MTTFIDFQTSLVNIQRHIEMMERMAGNTDTPYLKGKTFYEFVGTDVYEALRCAMADTLLWNTEQAIDLAETLGLDTLFYAVDYKWLISIRDWAISEAKYWRQDKLSNVELIMTLDTFEFRIPGWSSITSDLREKLRNDMLRNYYDAIDRS